MIRQESKYNKETYQLEEYKEYYNDVLVKHTKQDENNNTIFCFNGVFSWECRYVDGTVNNRGQQVYYKDSRGMLIDRRTHGDFVDVKIKIEPQTSNHQKYMELSVEWENISGCRYKLIAYKENGDTSFYTKFFEEKYPQYTISYNCMVFEEMYYQYLTLPTRRIIHHDVAYDMTNFKWLLEEFNVVLHSKRYRVELRNFREFVPIY
jgi:hypothetical protein